jgi:hypothetical protein
MSKAFDYSSPLVVAASLTLLACGCNSCNSAHQDTCYGWSPPAMDERLVSLDGPDHSGHSGHSGCHTIGSTQGAALRVPYDP